MERNIDTLGFYHINRATSPATETFVRWNSNNPATMRQIVSAKHDVPYMASDTITIEVESVAPMNGIEVGDYITHGGAKFRLNQSPDPTKTEERHFKYTFTFESVKYELIDALFLLVDGSGNPISEIVRDDFTGTMLEFLKLIVNNANRVHPNQWQIPLDSNGQWAGTATLPADAKTLSFDGQNCLNVLQNLCETWNEGTGNLEYKITESGGVKTIDIIERDKAVDYIDNAGQPFRYGYGNGLYEIERKATSAEKIITKLYAFGSKDNLPSRYFATRLALAKSRGSGTVGNKADSYIDRYTEGGQTIIPSNKYGVREGVVNLDEIKPHATWHVRSVGTITTGSDFYIYIAQGTGEPSMFDLNAKWKHYNADSGADYHEYLLLRNLADNANILNTYETTVADTFKYIATGEDIAVTFNSGDLAGLTFNVARATTGVDYNHGLLRLKLEPDIEHDAFDPSTGTTIANRYTPTTTIKPKAGDAFVFTGIQLPWSYVQEAETQLAAAALEKYKELSQPQATYAVKLANDFVNETYPDHDIDILECGKYLHIEDTDLGINHKIRITQYSRDLMKGYEYEVTISDFAPKRQTNLLTLGTANGNAAVGGTMSDNIPQGLRLDMEFTTAGGTSTLNFAAINTSVQYAILEDVGKGMRWTLANGNVALTDDTEYHIYISLTKEGAGSGTIYVRDARLRPQVQERAKLEEKNQSYLVLAGKVSRVTYTASATRAYRTVEMWLGRARNEAVEFIGTEIKDADGKLSIKLGSGATEMKLGDLTTAGLTYTGGGGVKMKQAKMKSGSEESTIACYRGEHEAAKVYYNGDIVVVTDENGNKTPYRCITNEGQGTTAATSDNQSWTALAYFEGARWDFVQLEQQTESTWQLPASDTRLIKSASDTRLYIDGERKFVSIDYNVASQRQIQINSDVPDGARVILEAIFL